MYYTGCSMREGAINQVYNCLFLCGLGPVPMFDRTESRCSIVLRLASDRFSKQPTPITFYCAVIALVPLRQHAHTPTPTHIYTCEIIASILAISALGIQRVC